MSRFWVQHSGFGLGQKFLGWANQPNADPCCGAPDFVVQPKDILTHSCVSDPNGPDGFHLTRSVKFSPKDNLRAELMRFSFSPPVIKMPGESTNVHQFHRCKCKIIHNKETSKLVHRGHLKQKKKLKIVRPN